jgi:hypothetical protein
MPIQRALLAALFVSIASAAFAQPNNGAGQTQQMGNREQRAACGPDVARYCKSVKPDDGPFAFLGCLQAHREKLRVACRKVLEDNGQ